MYSVAWIFASFLFNLIHVLLPVNPVNTVSPYFLYLEALSAVECSLVERVKRNIPCQLQDILLSLSDDAELTYLNCRMQQ